MKRAKPKAIGVDTETTGLNPWRGDRAWAVSAATADGDEWYWEWPVDPKTREVRPSPKDVREINLLLSDEAQPKAFWNASFDVRMLDRAGVRVRGPVEEVQWMVRACRNDLPSYKLKPIAKEHAGVDDDDQATLHALAVRARRVGKKLGWAADPEGVEPDYWMVPACARIPEARRLMGEEFASAAEGAAREYATRDAFRTALLREVFMVGMREMGVLDTWRFEMRLWPVTYRIEEVGVLVDVPRMRELKERCLATIEEAEAEFRRASGRADFNPASHKQLSEMLFGGRPLRLPVTKRTKKSGEPSVDGDALLPHAGNELVRRVLQHRGCEKAVSAFFESYEKLGEPTADGLVLHPTYNQWGTKTARYTCSKPALQQVSDPKTSASSTAEFVVNIREAFTPRPGFRWYMPDFSQVEVIIFADVSGEPAMLQAFRDGKDIHTMTANRVWGGRGNPRAVAAAAKLLGQGAAERDALRLLEEHGWDIVAAENAVGAKTWRKRGKAVTFTKIFGGGVGALMNWVPELSRREAVEVLSDYDQAFPEIKRRMRAIELEGLDRGYVLNAYGRRLAVDRHSAYRAVNTVVQSSAADLLKRGMLKVDEFLRDAGIDARIVLTVHDEVAIEWRATHAFKWAIREAARLLSDHGGVFSVPTPVEIKRVDERWSEQVKVDL